MSKYVTIAELKAFRPPGSTTTVDFSSFTDPELLQILDDVEAFFETETKNIFYKKTDTVRADGNGRPILFLPQNAQYYYPVLEVDSVKEVELDGTEIDEYTENNDFFIRGHELEMDATVSTIRSSIGKGGVWPKGRRNIEIVGKFGMETTPLDIKRAVSLYAICQSVGSSKAGLGEGGSSVGKDKVQQVWNDYTVTYRGRGSSTEQKQEDISNITGYLEIDRILSKYINYSGMFRAI